MQRFIFFWTRKDCIKTHVLNSGNIDKHDKLPNRKIFKKTYTSDQLSFDAKIFVFVIRLLRTLFRKTTFTLEIG